MPESTRRSHGLLTHLGRVARCQLVWLAVVALLGGVPHDARAQAVIDEAYLNVPFHPQETQVWCWVAAAKMVASYFNVATPSQCEMLQGQYGAPCCSMPQVCTRPGHIQEIGWLIQSFGLRTSQIGPPTDGWSLLEIFRRGRPIVFWVDGTHFVVASGIRVVDTAYGPLGIVRIMDPYYGVYDEPLPQLYARWGAALYVY